MEGDDILPDEIEDDGQLVLQARPYALQPVSKHPSIQFASLMQRMQNHSQSAAHSP